MKPLEKELAELQAKMEHTVTKQEHTQARFHMLREHATKDIMTLLLKDAKAYQAIFKLMDASDLKQFCDAVPEVQVSTEISGGVRQPVMEGDDPSSVAYLQGLYSHAASALAQLKTVLGGVVQEASQRQARQQQQQGEAEHSQHKVT